MKKPTAVDERPAETNATTDVRALAPVAFRISNFKRLPPGVKVARLTVTVEGVATFNCDAYAPADRPMFTAPAGVVEKNSGKWARRCWFDPDFERQLTEAVVLYLEAGDASDGVA